MNISRLMILLLVLFASGTADAYAAKEKPGLTGYVALAGPRGEQLVAYCVDGVFQYTAQTGGAGKVLFAGSSAELECRSLAGIGRPLSDYQTTLVTSPLTGWVVDPWSYGLETYTCQDGILTTLTGQEVGAPPIVATERSSMCDPSMVA